MFKFFLQRLNNKRGFTLIELIIVVAVLAILATIAVPQIRKIYTKAAIAAHNANVKTLESSANMYIMDEEFPKDTHERWTGNNGEGWENYITEWPKVPRGLKGQEHKYKENGKTETGSIGSDEKYEVTITENGEIIVKPGRIEVDN